MKISHLLTLATVAMATSLPSEPTLHLRGDSVKFGGIGPLTLMDEERPNELPTLVLKDGKGLDSLTIPLGTTQRDLFEVSDVEGAPTPTVQTFLVKGPESKLDVLMPVVMMTGGSDCAYEATIIGVTKQRPKEWLDTQLFVNTQGGYYVGDLGKRFGYGFAAWNFLWEDGAHYGLHRYEATLYRFDPESGRALKVAHLESKHKHDTDQGALEELGLHFKNFLRLDERFGC